MKATPIQSSFNAGEWAPELSGRTDLAKYGNSCYRMENCIPLVQGPVRRRAGSHFVAEVKSSGVKTWLVPFEVASDQAYVLEFGQFYIRFFANHAAVVSGLSPVEIASPYTTPDLVRPDGSFALSFVQSADVLYIAHPNFQTRKLSRTGPNTFVLSVMDVQGGPFEDINPDQTITMQASTTAFTGGVTITASASIFTPQDIGKRILIEQNIVDGNTQWEVSKTVTLNQIVRSDGKNYKATNAGTTGSVRPVHTLGTRSDGVINWQFLDPGYGWALITGYTSPTVVVGSIDSPFPNGAVSTPSNRWAFSSWNSQAGWPSHVTFFRERLCFARASDQKLWFSVAGDFEDFSPKDAGGNVVADQAISIRIDSDKIDTIQWLAPADALLVGTSGAEHAVREMTTNEAFGPGNVKITKQSNYGSSGMTPVFAGATIMFAQRSGRKLRTYQYDFSRDSYDGADMSALAPHFFRRGYRITQACFQQDPYSIVWSVRTDGLLLGFTFDQEQSVQAWHRHTFHGEVESVVSIPSPDGGRDDVWMITKRIINSITRRYVEYLDEEWDDSLPLADAFYVDSGLTYSGSPITTVSGLSHLEGEVVDVLADGAPRPRNQVIGGKITLDRPSSKLVVGIPCPAKVATMRLEAGAADGTAQGKIKRITHVTFRFMMTLGGKFGPSEDKLETIDFRSGSDPMDRAPPTLEDGDKRQTWNSGYEKEARIWYVNDQPLPFTLNAIIPEVNTQDR
jgi:hypothetical protein